MTDETTPQDSAAMSLASAGSHGDARRDSFKAFVLEWTGRSLEQHHAAGTTGLEFAWACWLRGGRLTDAEREAIEESIQFAFPSSHPTATTLRNLLQRTK